MNSRHDIQAPTRYGRPSPALEVPDQDLRHSSELREDRWHLGSVPLSWRALGFGYVHHGVRVSARGRVKADVVGGTDYTLFVLPCCISHDRSAKPLVLSGLVPSETLRSASWAIPTTLVKVAVLGLLIGIQQRVTSGCGGCFEAESSSLIRSAISSNDELLPSLNPRLRKESRSSGQRSCA